MRWWSAANLLSNGGTWMQLTAQNLLVLHLTRSAAATGLSLAAQAAPGLLLGPLGGAAVDGWPRRLTVAGSQALLALVAFATAALVAFHMLTVPVLMVLAGVTGLIATVDGPACALLGNDLVPARDVPSAIAVGSVVHSAGRVAGTALAGVTISVFGVAAAYAANGLSFLCVVAVVPLLPAAGRRRPAPPARSAPGGLRDGGRHTPSGSPVRDGVRYFFTRRRLVALAGLSALSSVLGRNYGLTLAALVTGPLHGSVKSYALISTVLAAGGAAGAVAAGRLRSPSVRLVAALALGGALLQAAGALSPGIWLLAVLVAPMAVAESVADTATATILQTDPPPRMRGRVLGAWRSLSTSWQLGGPPLLGLPIQAAGARGALAAGGMVTAGAIAAGGVFRARRPAPVPARAEGQAGIPAARRAGDGPAGTCLAGGGA